MPQTERRKRDGVAAMNNFVSWFLMGWAITSAIATPFVGRFVADRLTDTKEPDSSIAAPSPAAVSPERKTLQA